MTYNNDTNPYPTVAGALETINLYDLKELAKQLSPADSPTSKADAIALILKHLDGEPLRKLWDRLDDLQKAVIAMTVHGIGSTYNRQHFIARYDKEPNWGDVYQWPRVPSLLTLFFYHRTIPADLRARLKAFVPAPEPFILKVLDDIPTLHPDTIAHYDAETKKYVRKAVEIPIRQHRMERAAQHDLIAVLRLVGVGKVAVSDKTRFPTAATVKAITALLQGGDYYEALDKGEKKEKDPQDDDESEAGPIKGFAWPLILQAARLAELSGKNLTLTDAGRKALAAPPAKTLRAVWQAWLKTDVLDELRRINAIKGQTSKGKRALTKPAGRRSNIAQALRPCPVGRWISATDFMRQLRLADLDFEVTRDPWSLYLSTPSSGLGDGANTWMVLQERYLLCFLLEYAATLGLLDVATIPPDGARRDYVSDWSGIGQPFLSRYDGLLYLRLTPLGAYCLGLTPDYTPAQQEVKSSLKVLPNFDIVITDANLPSSDALLLATYAEQTSPAVWHLEAARLLEAMEAGHPLQELQEFLEARNGGELPGTVLRLLSDFAARNQRLKDRGVGRLIECSDDMLAALIANDRQAKKYCYLAGERYLVVPVEHESAFRKAVKQLGFVLPQ